MEWTMSISGAQYGRRGQELFIKCLEVEIDSIVSACHYQSYPIPHARKCRCSRVSRMLVPCTLPELCLDSILGEGGAIPRTPEQVQTADFVHLKSLYSHLHDDIRTKRLYFCIHTSSSLSVR